MFLLLTALSAAPALAQDCGAPGVACADDLSTALAAVSTPTYAITDTHAAVRDATTLRPTGETLAPGTEVEILEEKTKGRKTYVKVREITDPGATAGEPGEWWTAKSNLGSTKDYDYTLAPSIPVPMDGLRGLDRVMAAVYNSKGHYIAERAAELGVPAATLAAVLYAESRGNGFNADGTPVIRFENHYFFRRFARASAENRRTYDRHFQHGRPSWKGHKWREDGRGRWRGFHGNQAKEHQVLDFAEALDEEAARESISVGVAQIMGANHEMLGYDSAVAMYDALEAGIKAQLDGMVAFIENRNGAVAALQRGDFVGFASLYNGTGQAAYYGGRIRTAARSYERIERAAAAERQVWDQLGLWLPPGKNR